MYAQNVGATLAIRISKQADAPPADNRIAKEKSGGLFRACTMPETVYRDGHACTSYIFNGRSSDCFMSNGAPLFYSAEPPLTRKKKCMLVDERFADRLEHAQNVSQSYCQSKRSGSLVCIACGWSETDFG